jgi:hypothetical protein
MTSTAASTSSIAPYAYDSLPDQQEAAMLKAAAERIHNLRRAAVIDVGRELIAVKKRLDHGRFERWILAEFTMSPRTAQNYMAAAALVGEENETVSFLPPATLYKLGSTSLKAREEVINRLSRGEKLSPKEIGVVIRDVRHVERDEADRKRANLKRRQRPKKQENLKLVREKLAQEAAEAAAALDEVVGILRQSLSPEDAQRILDLARVIERDCYRICSLISVARAVAGSHNEASRNGAEQAACP